VKKPLSPAVELALLKLYQANPNRLILQKLINHNEGWLRMFCRKYYKSFRGVVSMEDLYQTATEGLIKGIQRYDLNSGVRLLTYANFWMMAVAFESLQASMHVHVPAHRLRDVVYRQGKQQAEALNKINDIIAGPLQLNRPFDNTVSEDVVLKRKEFGYDDDTTVSHLEKFYLPTDVDEALDRLPALTRDVFLMRVGVRVGGVYSFAEIADMLDIDQEEAVKLYKKAQRVLRREPALQRLAA
jgi:RNA polymerase sigma factor (sigma-70 family)